jgi:shikimate kinase
VNIILVGYRGAGKSTVGQLLARRMGWRFCDTDQIIAEQTGRSIVDIFENDGEAAFRRMERKVLESMRRARNRVICLGGGALAAPEIAMMVKRLGRAVWLRAPAAVLWARISHDPHSTRNRPDLSEGGLAEVESTLASREPLYASVAAHIVDTMAMTPAEVADSVEMWFRANDDIDVA